MVETGASGVRKADFSAVGEDIVPSVHNTYNLGTSAKQWAALFVVLAMVTSLTVGGVVKLSTVGNTLIINDSTQIQGTLTIDGAITSEDWTNVSITESQISDLQTYIINGTASSWRVGFLTGNFTGNLTLKDDLIMDQDDYINLGAGLIHYNGTCVFVEGSAATLQIC